MQYHKKFIKQQSPCILIVQLSLSPPASPHCIVYPLIPDCTVNDMLDIILGLVEDKSVEKSKPMVIGVNDLRLSPVENVSVASVVKFSSLILHVSIIESVTIH